MFRTFSTIFLVNIYIKYDSVIEMVSTKETGATLMKHNMLTMSNIHTIINDVQEAWSNSSVERGRIVFKATQMSKRCTRNTSIPLDMMRRWYATVEPNTHTTGLTKSLQYKLSSRRIARYQNENMIYHVEHVLHRWCVCDTHVPILLELVHICVEHVFTCIRDYDTVRLSEERIHHCTPSRIQYVFQKYMDGRTKEEACVANTVMFSMILQTYHVDQVHLCVEKLMCLVHDSP